MSWFGTSEEVIPYKVWRTRSEALKGVSIEAMRAVREGNRAIVVSFFKNRLEECKTFFNQKSIPFTDDVAGISSGATPEICLMMSTHAASLQVSSTPVVLLFYGIHPLPGREA